MGGGVTRQRLVSAFVAGLAGFGMLSAHALPPPDSSLDQQAIGEFTKAGLAVRERLDREAAGDPLGASIAAHEAELHRYRYLDLKRELNRRHPQPTAFLSVAAARDPFIPDGSFSADSGTSATRSVPKTAGDRVEVTSGLVPGDRIVVDGADKLRDGAKINVRTEAGAGATPAGTSPAGADKSGADKSGGKKQRSDSGQKQ